MKSPRILALDCEKLAWAAGFFDGEGSFSGGTGGHTRADGTRMYGTQAQIGQAEDEDRPGECPRVLVRFKDSIGFGNLMGPYRDSRTGRRRYWRYTAAGFEKTQAVYALLFRWLGPVKKAQGKRILSAHLAQPFLPWRGRKVVVGGF